MNQTTKALLKEIKDYDIEPEFYDFLTAYLEDKIESAKLFNIITENASRIPFDILCELMLALHISITDIEKTWGVQGFNEWFQEKHNETVWGGKPI